MKVLNLYAGIGGNRKLWQDVDVTAVEYNEDIAKIYQDFHPNDEVIVGDAHQYLLENFQDYDFIWSSPPCPSHSRLNTMLYKLENIKSRDYEFPDMKLYQEIIFLNSWFDGKWVVENVIPYYEPLIPAKEVDRHLFWSNFQIGKFEPDNKVKIKRSEIPELQKCYGYDLTDYKVPNKRKLLRNCVHPETGLHILNAARNIITKSNTEQTSLSL